MTSLQERLFAMQDKQYAAFQAKLTPGVPVESFIGIRVPVLRKFAKEFTKETECKEFLQQLPHEYYDENMLHGLLISEVKDYEECIRLTTVSCHSWTTGQFATSCLRRCLPNTRRNYWRRSRLGANRHTFILVALE